MLSPDDLWLAAHLGHQGAREVLGDEAPPVRAELIDWVEDLMGRGLAVRVAIAVAQAALPAFTATRPHDRRPVAALEMASSPRASRSPVKVVIEARMAAEEAGHGAPHWAALAAHWAGSAAKGPASAGQVQLDAWAAIDAAARVLGGEQEVRAAIALALLPEGLRDLAASERSERTRSP
jgi:hypothetical protein